VLSSLFIYYAILQHHKKSTKQTYTDIWEEPLTHKTHKT